MNPAAEVKSALNVGNIVKFAIGTFVFFFITDLAGVTNWFLQPYTSIRARFGKTGS